MMSVNRIRSLSSLSKTKMVICPLVLVFALGTLLHSQDQVESQEAPNSIQLIWNEPLREVVVISLLVNRGIYYLVFALGNPIEYLCQHLGALRAVHFTPHAFTMIEVSCVKFGNVPLCNVG